MVNNLIGNKDYFAIEYSIESCASSSHVIGNIRLWFNGIYIGAFEDVSPLLVTLNQLENVLGRNINTFEFYGCSKESIYCAIKNDVNGGCHYLSLGESFDDFSVIVFIEGDFIIFIWKIEDLHYFKYSNYPKDIQRAIIDINQYKAIVNDFKMALLKT